MSGSFLVLNLFFQWEISLYDMSRHMTKAVFHFRGFMGVLNNVSKINFLGNIIFLFRKL